MPQILSPTSSIDPMSLTTARDWIRQWARNAQSSAQYSNSDIDRALYSVGTRFCRQTRSVTRTSTIAAATGQDGGSIQFSSGGNVTMPEQLTGARVISTGDKITVLNAADLEILVANGTNSDGDVTTGVPLYAAIDESYQAISPGAGFALNLYPYADLAYDIKLSYWLNFTRWTIGTDSPDSILLNIPEPWLVEGILPYGCPATLQHNQPEMLYADKSFKKYLDFERSHQGAGILGVKFLDRVKRA